MNQNVNSKFNPIRESGEQKIKHLTKCFMIDRFSKNTSGIYTVR